MTTEIEIKLLLSPSQAEKLLKDYLAEGNSSVMKNSYFDTPNLDLHQHKSALRIRNENGQWLETFKGPNLASENLQHRNEYEYSISSNNLDLSLFPKQVQKFLLPIENKLRPIFETNFQRIKTLLTLHDETIVEFAIDKGHIICGDKTLPISKLELELKSGDKNTMLEFAHELQKSLQLEPGTQTKAERGYQLYLEQQHE